MMAGLMARSRKRVPFEPTAEMPVVLLHGKEPFLLRERSRQLVDVLEAEHGEIEQFTYDGTKADLVDVLDELRSYGLLQRHRLVIVDRADQFLAGNEARRRAMESYVEAPVEHSTLLLRAETWRPGKLDKLIAGSGLVHKVEPVDHATATAWCGARARSRYDAEIEPRAASTLVELIGTDLGRLDVELSKLASYTGTTGPITTGAVAELVGLSREEQAWTIQSAILSGDSQRALETLHQLLNVSRHPEVLVAWAITDLVRRLHSASRMLHDGMTPGDVAQDLRLWGEARTRILETARRIEPDQLASLLRSCIEADRRSKRGFGQQARTLEGLTVLVTDRVGSAVHAAV